MSFEATAWARTQMVGNSPAKFVLLILADYAGTDYSCYPGLDALAKLTEMDERTVRRATTRLIEQGLIRSFYRYRANGSQRSCRYQLLVDGPDTAEPDAEDWAAIRTLCPEGYPDSGPPTPGHKTPPGGAESPAIPITDPSLDPSLPVVRAPRSKRATRIPVGFQPTDDMRAWYASEKFEQLIDGRIEHDKFVDYWIGAPGAKALKQDWPATWRNWMRSAAERSTRRPGNSVVPVSGAPYRPSTTDQKVAQTLELGRRLQQQMEEDA